MNSLTPWARHGLYQFKAPETAPINHPLIFARGAVDATGLGIIVHGAGHIAALQFNIANFIERAGARGMIPSKALQLNGQSLFKVVNGQFHYSEWITNVMLRPRRGVLRAPFRDRSAALLSVSHKNPCVRTLPSKN
jgi:hypothetical protein